MATHVGQAILAEKTKMIVFASQENIIQLNNTASNFARRKEQDKIQIQIVINRLMLVPVFDCSEKEDIFSHKSIQ